MPRVSLCCCKRWATYLTMATFFFVGGIEYSVIFPTMFDYVNTMGGEEWLYGLALSAFSISNFITSPLYGVIFDKTQWTKVIVMFGNLFEIVGNLMYFVAYTIRSPYLILASRFVVGLGAGAGAALFADLALVTTKKQRTTIFSLFMSMRQVGMVIGPAFNLFLEETNFSIGPLKVNNFSSPGLFMAVIWIGIEIMFLCLYFKLPRVETDNSPVTTPTKSPDSIDTANSSPGVKETQALLSKDPGTVQEAPPVYGTTSPTRNLSSVNTSQSTEFSSDKYPSPTEPAAGLWSRISRRGYWLLGQMVQEQIIVLLAVLFVTIFNQAAVETMFVPMSEDLLNWHENEISYFYSGAGLEIVIAFVMVSIISHLCKIGDRFIMLSGLVVDVIGYGWLLGLVGNATSETPWVMWRYILGGALILWGLPFVMVSGASLYSKLLPPQIQGFGQGIRRSVFSIGAILGPLWGGSSQALGSTYYILLGVPSGLYLLSLVLVLLSICNLAEPKSQSDSEQDQESKSEKT